MKRIVLYFLFLLSSVWFGIIMYRNPGYILLAFSGWSIETSLWTASIILLISFVIFYWFLRLSGKIATTPSQLKNWFRNRQQRRTQTLMVSGLFNIIEGKWLKAESKFIKAAKHNPLINYLAAAFVAQRQHALERCNNYLLLAQKTEHQAVIGLARAQLQICNRQWEEAVALLQNLQQLQPKNVLILQLLKQAYWELKDWERLQTLLPWLRKYRAFSPTEIAQLELQVYQELLTLHPDTWHMLPSYLQKQPALVAIYTKYLLTNNKTKDAETILKMILRKVLDADLLELYAALPNTIKKLARAEKWLKTNPENAALLLCLGRICKQQQLWGKAYQYLELSVRLAPTADVYTELGQIAITRNDLRGALNYYSKGLQCK